MATARTRLLLVSPALLATLALPCQTPKPDPTADPANTATKAEAADSGGPAPEGSPAGIKWIDREDLRRHATFLASDELGGRYTGTEGQLKAANYIAAHFEQLGLKPLGDKGRGGRSYLQKYPLVRTYLDPKATSITVGQERVTDGFAVIRGKAKNKVKVSGGFVFCGDGSPDEIPRGAFKRKVPVIVLGGSSSTGPRATMRGRGTMQRAASVNRELAGRGAQAVLFCLLDSNTGTADMMNYSALLPGKPLLTFGNNSNRHAQPHNVPSIFAGKPLALKVLANLGIEVKGGQFEVSKKTKATGKVQLTIKDDKKFHAVNVVAHIEGSDRGAAKDAVVFSAHMDHIGTRLDGDAFNGADDNASGTSGLLDIAEAFAKGEPPRRSVVFLAVSGEELGLWGSQYYSEHPTWPLGRIIADVNIDMIGRNTDLSPTDTISVTPSHRHSQYSTLVRTASALATKMGMSLTSGDTYYERSDHYNFAKKGVPVVFFCDGEHEDYHKVTDHADKLDFAKMEQVARLAYWTGFEAAQAKGRPKRLGSQRSW